MIRLDRNIAVRTSLVTLVVSGVIDLKTTALELYAQTRATTGVGIEAGKLTDMFKIEGAISAPSIGVNPQGVLDSSVSIGAAFATSGLSLLLEGLTKHVDSNPCETALTLPVRR
jgi:hypothetical protein